MINTIRKYATKLMVAVFGPDPEGEAPPECGEPLEVQFSRLPLVTKYYVSGHNGDLFRVEVRKIVGTDAMIRRAFRVSGEVLPI